MTDSSGTKSSSDEDSLAVMVNARPIADPGPDLIVAPGEKVVLDGSRSLDQDGDIAEYRWDFRDGAKSEGRIVSHSFDRPGIYDVRLGGDRRQRPCRRRRLQGGQDHRQRGPGRGRRRRSDRGPGRHRQVRRSKLVRSGRQDRRLSLGFQRRRRPCARFRVRTDLRDIRHLHGPPHRGRRQRRVERL